MHILIVGADGMLGRELVALLEGGLEPAALRSRFAGWTPATDWLSEAATVKLTAVDVAELDITQAEAVQRMVGRIRPGLVINAAAYTDVDGCESHEAQAAAVNAGGPAHLADACREYGSRLVHVSTDYVFDGAGSAPYRPEHPVAPQSAYGRTKAAGEAEIRRRLPAPSPEGDSPGGHSPEGHSPEDRLAASHAPRPQATSRKPQAPPAASHVIVRTSWLFGVHGKNFVKTIARLAAERPELRVVTDQVGCPTSARDLAAALCLLGLSPVSGTHHFCNAGACSWHGFASEIVRLTGSHCRILPQTTAELNRPAPRPAYSVLSTESFTQATGAQPRPWQAALAECVSSCEL